MIKADEYFKRNLSKILEKGYWDESPRAKYKDGSPAYSKFITQVWEEYDISNGEYPFTTLRPTAIKTGIQEILWIFQEQSTHLDFAKKMGVTWWESWDVGDRTIGERYGATVKKYDLINNLLNNLKNDPFGRRHIMNLWQEEDLKSPGLKPCAYETIWSCRKSGSDIRLDLTLVQRSSDYIVAGYINKMQYVALQKMIAYHCGYKCGKFCHLVQNLHIYDRHLEAAQEILLRDPTGIQPKLFLNGNGYDFYKMNSNNFIVWGKEYIHPKLNSPLELAI